MSANSLVDSGGIYTYNFITGTDQTYGTSAQINLGDGIYGMHAGDFNSDGNININDKANPWELYSGTYGYTASDIDLGGQAVNKDKNDLWAKNNGQNCQVPK